MKKIFFLTLISVSILTYGQSVSPDVISSTGDYYITSKVSLSWTLGEMITETVSNSNTILTQGFQQPSYQLVSIYEHPDISFDVNIYPNPTYGSLTIDVTKNPDIQLKILIYDLQGKQLENIDLENGSKKIDISSYGSGNYLLSFVSNRGEIIRTFKILKLN